MLIYIFGCQYYRLEAPSKYLDVNIMESKHQVQITMYCLSIISCKFHECGMNPSFPSQELNNIVNQ